MTEKNLEPMEMKGPGASESIDFDTLTEAGVNVDKELVDSLESEIAQKKDELKNKLYAITFTEELLERYENFIMNEAEWNSTEALGIKEVHKQIQRIKKEGVKNSVIFMGALPLEASHYFISKSKGRGLKEAQGFLDLYKPFDQALSDAKNDVAHLKDLEKQLAAAMQGISLG
jgi:hypothetical protein